MINNVKSLILGNCAIRVKIVELILQVQTLKIQMYYTVHLR
jgi:hypothetical protein